MLNITMTWLLSATFLFFTSRFLIGFDIPDFAMAFIASLFIGLVNILVRPLMRTLEIRLNFLNLGLFAFALNVVTLKLAANLMKSFEIEGWLPAVFAATFLAAIQVIAYLMRPDKRKLLWQNN